MQQEKANFSMKRMARLLKVSRSGYYAWAAKDEAKRMGRDLRQAFIDDLDCHIDAIWEDSDGVYGAPRITAMLAKRGITVNKKTVAKRMRVMGIEGISPRAFVPGRTIASEKRSTLPDLVNGLFDVGELNRVWLVTLPICAPVKVGYTCVWFVMVIPAVWLAGRWIMPSPLTWWNEHYRWRTRCAVRSLRGLVFHADRGTQYTSEQIWRVCQDLGIAQSVGRTGVCFDNAMSESFWSTLKTEFYDRKKWPTRHQARKAVAQLIEVVYNRRRIHSSLGMQTAVTFENSIIKDPIKSDSATPKAA